MQLDFTNFIIISILLASIVLNAFLFKENRDLRNGK